MLLISKFDDYYESAGLAFGVDNKLVYERKTEEVSINLLYSKQKEKLKEFSRLLPSRSTWQGGWSLYNGIIGFCGRLYPVYKLKIDLNQ